MNPWREYVYTSPRLDATGQVADLLHGRARQFVEPLGDGFHVYLNVDGQVLVAKIAGGSTVIGKTLSLNIEKGKMHIFDSETEERLNAG